MRLAAIHQNAQLFQRNRPFIVQGTGALAPVSAYLERADGVVVPPKEIELGADGSLCIEFPPCEGSFLSYSLHVEDKVEKIVLQDLVAGDLFLCLGQSNMSLPLSMADGESEILPLLGKTDFRVLNLEDGNTAIEDGVLVSYRPFHPQREITQNSLWQKSLQMGMSAFGLSFLAFLSQRMQECPIGIVVAASGGISIDSMLPREAIDSNEKISEYLRKTRKYEANEATYHSHGTTNFTVMSGFYNEKIAPLSGVYFRAALYYQGENSAFDLESAHYFQEALRVLLNTYRTHLREEHLPFFITGLADEYYPYGDGHGYSYITEVLASFEGDDLYHVPYYDIAPAWQQVSPSIYNHPIHPTNKTVYAKRLVDAVFASLYQGRPYRCPRIVSHQASEDGLLLSLSNCAFQKGTKFPGFQIAGQDGIYQPAEAIVIKSNEMLLRSKEVPHPIDYAYGIFQYSYEETIHDEHGLPLLPSRSEKGVIDRKRYLLNRLVFSCDYLEHEFNNFGSSVGGGFPLPLWEKGRFYPYPEVKLSLGKDHSIAVEYVLPKEAVGYFSVRMNLAGPGLFHRLAYRLRFLLDIQGQDEVTVEGMLFSVAGHIKRFPVLGKKALSQKTETYVISLEETQDGSEGPSPTSKEVIDSLSFVELYFRSSKEKGRLILSHIRDADEAQIKEKEKDEGLSFAGAVALPGGDRS